MKVLIRIHQFQARQKTPDKQNKKNDILKIMKILIRVSGEGGGGDSVQVYNFILHRSNF